MNKKFIFLFFILLVLAIAVFFRFWQLDQVPPGLYPDVAINGTDALNALKTGEFKLFYPENNGREGLFINLIAFSFYIFGASVWAIKVVPAIIGVLTVLGLFLLARSLFYYLPREKSNFIALLSAFFLSIGFWHVNFSRLGFRAIMVPFFLIWSFYFLFKALRGQSKNIWNWIFGGVFFGLGFHTYISYRVAPLIFLPIALFVFISYWPRFKDFSKEQLGKWAIFVAGAILAAAPMIFYFATHPQDFIGRAGQVSVFASSSPVKELAVSIAKTLGMFNVTGDCNWRHNDACQPELLWPVGIFFLIGFFFGVMEIFRISNYRQKRWPSLITHWTLLFIFFTMLLPAILSREGLPHALRSIGAIPPVFIWSGMGLFLIFDSLKKLYFKTGAKLITLYTLLFLTLGGLVFAEYNKYFFDWGLKNETKAEFTQPYVDMGNYLNSLPAEVKKYVIANQGGTRVPYPDGIPMPAQTVMFISYQNPAQYLLPEQISQIQCADQNKCVVLLMAYNGDIFARLKKRFPKGQTEEIQKEFSVFKINF